jgi:exoribonuclease-2
MLPDDAIAAFTLAAGGERPALSLYVEIDAGGRPLRSRTAVERVPVVDNLRLDAIDEAFAAPAREGEPSRTAELRALWQLAQALAEKRARPDVARIDYSFDVDWSVPEGRVAIVPRPRGSPLDKLVAELMIHVNDTWGRLLAERGVPGFYRVQSAGKVKMSVRPGEHQGLGLAHYLWASSPLRRYSDLVNQQQLVAVVAGHAPPYAANDAALFAALADFEATYSQYAEFQDRMERYWCLRYLVQEGIGDATAVVVRDNLVRFASLPLVVRLADLPPQPVDTVVRVAITHVDLLAATLDCRFINTLPP